MALTSTKHRCGSVAASLHWLSAFVLFALVASGLRLEAMAGASGTAALLRLHLSLGVIVFALTLARILWWVFADRHPEPVGGGAAWQARAARLVHWLFYPVILLAAASGIATIAVSGAVGPLFFGDPAPLPDFSGLAPRRAHGFLAWALIVLTGLHVAAALYHQLVKRDRILARILPALGRARQPAP
ncbi:cytochrome b/b6 domain-containing protein [Nitratireductor sp. StC3]|uniref:cytochrome b n=1 Tax=Nitratireductor sp. StC3 TaxID=2126741 RepID=UPI000D0CB952|nr:cytochrome b/b6 domain-containing protein [Nitratireductor sp. StC3]PSM15961.1 cytochrome B [Nitratireductor sp. StC3]